MAISNRMINEWWITDDVEGSSHGLLQHTTPPFTWRKTMKYPSQNSQVPPGYHLSQLARIECWVGPRAGLDAMEKRKISCPCCESNPGCPAHSLVSIPAELSWLLNLLGMNNLKSQIFQNYLILDSHSIYNTYSNSTNYICLFCSYDVLTWPTL
jgi:hypothetical protein